MAESIGGGYDYVFITDLPEDLICTLCHLAFKTPLQIEECGHTFCKLCFDQMVDHAENNSLDITCPLDRQKIDVSRVFKDKSDERKVLNLIVHVQTLVISVIGQVHEIECCKNITMLIKPFDEKLSQLLYRMEELETKTKSHELKLAEKDKQMEEQSKQIDNLVKQVKTSQHCENNMIMQNIEGETNFYPICTAFQWKFKPTEIRSGVKKFSPPFYNSMNPHCFQLSVCCENNNFFIILYRYRGKYDHILNGITVTKKFIFEIQIFGKNGKLKNLKKYSNDDDYSIAHNETKSRGYHNKINNGEIGSLTVADGYVNLQCSFNKTA